MKVDLAEMTETNKISKTNYVDLYKVVQKYGKMEISKKLKEIHLNETLNLETAT